MLVLTPEAQNRLVLSEALAAFARHGWQVAARPKEALAPQALARLFALPPHRSNLTVHPSLFFSVNFHGLDKRGEVFDRLHASGVPVAVWAVDNPWNLLAGLRVDFWKKIRLFVTDASFIPGLREAGAEHVAHLPLGTDADLFAPLPKTPSTTPAENMRPLVFAGRSRFPDKERFFVGQRLDPVPLRQAKQALATGQRPDFFWWREKLKLTDSPLWPGSAARKISLGTEETSLVWRLVCLRASMPEGLSIFGDEGWRDHFSRDEAHAPDLRSPVDYYGALPYIYREAEFSLAVTSLLLPCGLNQRHFDVWAAGGFCLSDATPGLELFPPELTKAVTFTKPEDIAGLVRHFRQNPKEKADLARRWREHILAEHSYDRRIAALLGAIFS